MSEKEKNKGFININVGGTNIQSSIGKLFKNIKSRPFSFTKVSKPDISLVLPRW